MHHYTKRQSGQTWDSVPSIGGSRWGFIGAMAAVLVVIIIAIIVCVCVCRRRGSRKRMRHAAMGSDLSALHPAPSFGRPKASRLHTMDDDEGDAFVASSPRESMGYGEPMQYGGHQQDMQMQDINSRYYRGSEGFQQGYQPYGTDNRFAEPEWEAGQQYQQQQQQQQQGAMAHPHSGYGYPAGHGYQESEESYHYPASQAPTHYSQPSNDISQSSQHPLQYSHPSSGAGRAMGPRSVPSAHSHPSLPAPSAYPQQSAYREESGGGYDQSYYHSSDQEPPVYPQSSTMHTHDAPKTRMGPAAV